MPADSSLKCSMDDMLNMIADSESATHVDPEGIW